MQIFIHRPEGNLGPYSPEQLSALIANGAVAPGELAWHEGLPEWTTAQALLPAVSSAPLPAPTPGAAISSTDAVQIREKYINHEASVRSIGLLYILGGTLAVILGLIDVAVGAIGLVTPSAPQPANAMPPVGLIVLALFLIVLGSYQIFVALRIRKLDRRAVIPTSVLAAIGLLGIPVGTLINGYILYLIHCAKGKYVFSDEYRQVIEATPQIRYRTSIIVKILLGLIVGIILLVIVGSLISALSHH